MGPVHLLADETGNAAGGQGAPAGLRPAAASLPPERASRLGRLRRLRRLARLRRRAAAALLLAPALLVLAADVCLRGERLLGLRGKHVASYAAAIVESAVLWGLLLYAASARRGPLRWVAASLFVLLGTLAVGGQLYFHGQYSTYLNLDATLFGTSFMGSLVGQLGADGPNFALSMAPPLLLAALLVVLSRRVLRPRQTRAGRAARWLAPLAAALAFVIPCSYRTVQASTPDVIYFHAIGGLLKNLTGVEERPQVRPGLRTPLALPPLAAASKGQPGGRNVLFVLTESVRSDCHCSGFEPSCPVAPRTNVALPERLPLRQMRSNSSTTAIQLAVLWSGLPPTASREALHSAPLLFDYAHAAGMDTAYWTSHHMMFANSRLFVQDLPTKFQCGATDLDPLADIDLGASDELLVERAMEELPSLREPFFAVAHVGNTHVPYRIDEGEAPFSPWKESKDAGDNEAYRNFYKNAVHAQDKAIARLLEFVRKSDFGERTVIVFTSDHGEAFREHGQLGHTGAVLDEEIHVPAWIDAPAGLLTGDELLALESAENAPAFHTDVAPTILDLFGLWDAPELAPFREAMVGESLLRPRGEPRPLALTNCTGIWGCAFRNWGMMQGFLKIEAREWDGAWHCYDLASDPEEKRDLGPAACGDLVRLADATFGGPPSGE